MNLNNKSLLRSRCLVGGGWIESITGRTIEVRNPATGELLGAVPSLAAKKPARLSPLLKPLGLLGGTAPPMSAAGSSAAGTS